MQYLATQCPSSADALRLIDALRLNDATPVPGGTSRQTVKRSELAGWANYGYCAGCLADPKLGEPEVTEQLFAHARELGAQVRNH